MLIKCCFAIIVMVDTIFVASSQNSFKFLLAFGTIHHVLMQHLDFYLDHTMFFLAQVWGGYMRNSFQPIVHCIYMCMHLFLVD
jgi:isoprenylcysteine carboxyl methyltransferase (ICMT) family protein YpbQ